MSGRLTTAVLVLATLAVATIGAVDALRGRSSDLVAVFALVAVLQLVVLARLQLGRRPATLRPDLAAWLEERAAHTGEPVEHLLDRSVAERRAALRHGA